MGVGNEHQAGAAFHRVTDRCPLRSGDKTQDAERDHTRNDGRDRVDHAGQNRIPEKSSRARSVF